MAGASVTDVPAQGVADSTCKFWHANWLSEFKTSCMICLSEVDGSSPALVPCCGAIFCETCLAQWLDVPAGRTVCPLCKTQLSTYITVVNVPPILFESVSVLGGSRQWSLPPGAWRRLVYSFRAFPDPPLAKRALPPGVITHRAAAPLRRWVRRDIAAISSGDPGGSLGDMAVALLAEHGSGTAGRQALQRLLPNVTAHQLCDELEMWTAALPRASCREEHDDRLKERYVFHALQGHGREGVPSLPIVQKEEELPLQRLLSSLLTATRMAAVAPTTAAHTPSSATATAAHTPSSAPATAAHTPSSAPATAAHTPSSAPATAAHTPSSAPVTAAHTPSSAPATAAHTPSDAPVYSSHSVSPPTTLPGVGAPFAAVAANCHSAGGDDAATAAEGAAPQQPAEKSLGGRVVHEVVGGGIRVTLGDQRRRGRKRRRG